MIFNEEVARSLFVPVILLCLHSYLFSLKQVPATIAVAIGKPEIELKTSAYSLIIVIPFSIYTIQKFGLVGAPLGLLMLDFIYYVYTIPRYCRSCLNLPVLEWYIHAFRFIGLLLIPYGIVLFAVTRNEGFRLFELAAGYLVATALFLVGSYFAISNEFRAAIVSFVGLKMRQFNKAH